MGGTSGLVTLGLESYDSGDAYCCSAPVSFGSAYASMGGAWVGAATGAGAAGGFRGAGTEMENKK